MTRQAFRRIFIGLLALLLVAGCSPARFGEASRVLADIDAGTGPSALKETTPRPERRIVNYSVSGRAYGGDLYFPGETARAAMVLVPGVSPDGKDDRRLGAVVTFFTTGRYRESPEDAWRERRPNIYGKWVFLESNLDRIDSPADRARLRLIKESRLRDPAADVSPWAAELGAEGRAVHDLIDNTDADRVPGLIAALPERLRADFAALDLSAHDLGGLTQRFFLVHGRNDPVIPETETLKLARALPDGRAEPFLVDSLDHVNPKPIGLADKLTLLRAIYGVLGVRDGN